MSYGINSENREVKPRKTVAYDRPSGGYGIRDSVRNSGLDDSKLSWDGTYVSYNGQKIKPSAAMNGTTYAKQNDINDFIKRAYASDGRKLVQANKYQNPYGINGLGWNDATKEVTVNGKPIQYAYGDNDGNAWVEESVIKKAYDDMAAETGVKAPSEYEEEYNRRLAAAEAARADILKEQWKYSAEDMERDAAYQAYKNLYERQAQKAYDDMLGRMAARNGGGLTSAAQLAAASSYNEQMQGLADRVPELEQMAYERFVNDRAAQLEGVNALENGAYNRYAVGRDTGETAYTRQNESRDREVERKYEPINLEAARKELSRSGLENESLSIANESARKNITQADFENAYSRAMVRGYFTDAEAEVMGLSRNENGEYPSPWSSEIQRMLAEWELVTKPQLEYEYGRNQSDSETKYYNELALEKLKAENDLTLAEKKHAYDMELQKLKNSGTDFGDGQYSVDDGSVSGYGDEEIAEELRKAGWTE